MAEPNFRQYRAGDRDSCLAIFDANCPEFFAPNERADYERFLADLPADYQVCVDSGRIRGAFGVLPQEDGSFHLRWILLHPGAQGRGIGASIMSRVVDCARSAGATCVHIGASHKSSPFFARFGATVVSETPDGWGEGMHRLDMDLRV